VVKRKQPQPQELEESQQPLDQQNHPQNHNSQNQSQEQSFALEPVNLEDDYKSPQSTSSESSSSTAITIYSGVKPSFNLNSFHNPNDLDSTPFRYLWDFYIQSTSRFCAIHDFETPFLSSVVPLACNNPELQASLMYLSSVHRSKILQLTSVDEFSSTNAQLAIRSMRGLRNILGPNKKMTQELALVGIATCLGLTCCHIGENSSLNYNTHLAGALTIATQILIPNPKFTFYSHETWFLFKWLTYCTVLININLFSQPLKLINSKVHSNLTSLQILRDWWGKNDKADPEYNLPVDSFYGFSTRLAPLLLDLNILVTKNCNFYHNTNSTIFPATEEEINTLERTLWNNYNSSIYSMFSPTVAISTQLDLAHCDAAFHASALLYVYTYLKPQFDDSGKQRIAYLVQSVISEVEAISPSCRTAAALLFVMYIAGSYATPGRQRNFFKKHLEAMVKTCLSSVESVLAALQIIWKLRDDSYGQKNMVECQAAVLDSGINVCVY
jgi:hypothetical protein